MRPVNLIPPEEQRGERAPLRTGGMVYVLVGMLAVLLLAVTAVAVTGKSISDKRSEKDALDQELSAVQAHAQALRPFADFRAVQQARGDTVTSLATSRFDWERVMRELALILPEDVWLVNLTGTVSPDVQVTDGAEITARDEVEGPALEIIGCGPGQEAVATFIAALEDIDGVTRVGLASSEKPSESAQQGGGAEDVEDCRTREFIARFEIVVAFDAVPVPETATQAPGIPAPIAPGGSDTQLADAQAQQAAAAGSVEQQTTQAQKAADYAGGG